MKTSSLLIKACMFIAVLISVLVPLLIPTPVAAAQDTVTGAFEGTVTSSQTGRPIAQATAQIINQQTNLVIEKRTDSRGRFYQGLLTPGIYTIRVSAPGFQTQEVIQRLSITRTGEVVPVPVTLDPASAVSTSPASPAVLTAADTDIRAKINSVDARRDGSFSEEEVEGLPLGGTTLVRSFDELALLLPGVAPPPQTLGGVAGPGVGAGVGSAGQFAVNGLRSRANNFTVDGSDNNDEDIGVRRQGFLALIPQPIESIKEYQVITLLAPAQFGRNIGAQVNAVSKSGGNETHGSVYGFFNSSQLNARNFFDTTNGTATSPVRTNGGQPVLGRVFDGLTLIGLRPFTTRNRSGGEDSLTYGQGGFVLGGPLAPNRMFYFISGEGQLLNATREASFAVPTVDERGIFGTGATGIFADPFTGAPVRANPSSANGEAIFSLFPFPNNPAGVYGRNTFTQMLPASAEGKVLSGKFDGNFRTGGRQQSVTGRYNFTDDWRTIPVTGGALFSALRPRVRTQNFSFFYNSEVSGPGAARAVFNQVRLSYGRTRLRFEEVPDREFLIRSDNFPETDFLLNVPEGRVNFTLPPAPGVPNTGPVEYGIAGTTEDQLVGPVGQIIIAGFSPLGVDVFNFPQRRVNNTYQAADTLTLRTGNHSLAFGVDTRRTELNSDLPRNSRPLITFYGNRILRDRVIRSIDLAAAGAASGFFLTLERGESSNINLRYHQLNFFGQDDWRIRPNLSLSYGLRYEFNTPAREVNRRIEDTFDSPELALFPGLRRFLDGRTRIFDPDRDNLAPRVGLAYSPDLFGRGRATVVRGGYGLFYDQVLGAVVSQSRNVFPSFLTVNLAGGLGPVTIFQESPLPFFILNPANPFIINSLVPPFRDSFPDFAGLVQPGTLNTLVPGPLRPQIDFVNLFASNGGTALINPTFSASGVGITLPARRLETPTAHHYSLTLEQQLTADMVVSAAYVGTLGRKLLRFTTPNLGQNVPVVPLAFVVESFVTPTGTAINLPGFIGVTFPPLATGSPIVGRPVPDIGAVNIFETTARSHYDSLQLQLRGRFRRSVQYQAAYTFSKAIDDVSDVFDLAGASALPQNSIRIDERGPANFDARHRFTYNFIYDLPVLRDRRAGVRVLFGGFQVAGTGRFQTGQPFTVNSTIDVNGDGNLTDRLNTTEGIVQTGDRRRPLRLTTADTTSLLASYGRDGAVGRNTFRAGNILELDLAVTKNFAISERQAVIFRAEVFNFINRANFGIPVRFLEAPGFGEATDTVTPGRRIQVALKYSF